MGFAKKGKRKIIVATRFYYWYVREEPYAIYTSVNNVLGYTVYIVSEDRKFAVHYILDSNFIAITGNDFPGKPSSGITWRVYCPVFSISHYCTPKVVSAIINWCFSDKELIPVDWKGLQLEPRIY